MQLIKKISAGLLLCVALVGTMVPTLAASPAGFTDVFDGTWYTEAVNWCKENGIMSGTSATKFAPDTTMSRAMLAAVLYRSAGSPEVDGLADFSDVPANAYYNNAAKWASDHSYISGYGNRVFGSDDPVTREQIVAILWRYEGRPTADAPDFADESSISTYAGTAVDWARANSIVSGVGNNRFDPKGGASRAQTAMHYQVAEDHGFTAIADFQILDEDGSMSLPVTGGIRLTENYVGAAFDDYDSYLVLSHFKGYAMAGYGGAIKNISIGLGSSRGKSHIHSGGTGSGMWGGEQAAFLESMAEAGKSVSDYLGNGERIVYINVVNRLSVDCDCDGNPAEPDMHDIGILASTDPVALDQACIDFVYGADDGQSLIERIESRNGLHTLEHAAEIGLGSREYRLVEIDE